MKNKICTAVVLCGVTISISSCGRLNSDVGTPGASSDVSSQYKYDGNPACPAADTLCTSYCMSGARITVFSNSSAYYYIAFNNGADMSVSGFFSQPGGTYSADISATQSTLIRVAMNTASSPPSLTVNCNSGGWTASPKSFALSKQ